MQTVTNLHIVNLAVGDECFLLIGIPFLINTMIRQSWPLVNIMCKAHMATTSISQFTRSIFLTIMSADRYIAVCHPISSPKIRTPFISKVNTGSEKLNNCTFLVFCFAAVLKPIPVVGTFFKK
jgi:hypothetical protein